MHVDDPVVVWTLTNPIEAEMIKNALHDEGIKCFLGGIHQATTAGLPGTSIQVQVPAEHADRARKFIEKHEQARSHPSS
jgi:hypothetical protein